MQVFQTDSPQRWKRFRWLSRIIFVIAILTVVVIGVALKKEFEPAVPRLKTVYLPKEKLTAKWLPVKGQNAHKRYPNFAAFFLNENKKQRVAPKAAPFFQATMAAPMRAAFYVAWDAQSYFSLKSNLSHLNTLLPEWFFVTPEGNLRSNIDERGFKLVKASGIKVLPMLSNNYLEKFRPEGVHRILNDTAYQAKFIQQLLYIISANHFDGINIDFEELQEKGDESLIHFMKNLSIVFHAHQLLVTQDVSPFNEDYNYEKLQQYNDYIFLMAYDEHTSDTSPGPISSQRWIEGAVDLVARKVPSQKIVLGLAAYGYDWQEGNGATDLTYQEALSTAREEGVKPVFDNDTYNLSYSYKDDDSARHEVQFTDAASNFNAMRFAAEFGLGGTAIWRMGSEDSRVWDFYTKDISRAAMPAFNFSGLYKVPGSNDVDYIGEGEVLDMLSTPDSGRIIPEIDKAEWLISEENYVSLPSMFVVKKWGKPESRKMVLSFDDGPDPVYTRQILDTLAKYHVPASFFVVGLQAEENIPLVERIYREGHELGNHTFTHPNMAEVSRHRSKLEMDATRLLLECITGHSTILFRAPYNADSEPETMQELIPVADSRKRNYLTIGESIDPEDWEAGTVPHFNADTIFNRVVAQQADGNIILLHDAGGPREATVEALPRIIQYFRSRGYQFTTVADLLGKTRDEVMPPVPVGKLDYLYSLSRGIASTGYMGGNLLYYVLLSFIILGIARFVFLLAAAGLQSQKEKLFPVVPIPANAPAVSIIVPAYNEEVNIVASLKNLLLCNYPSFEIIFVDDGSKDSTYSKAADAMQAYPQVRLFSKPNGGKASALNFGIAQSAAAYVVCIDADTRLRPDAVGIMMQHFFRPLLAGKKVGAVAGNVKVGNEKNTITRWQSLEYITSQNFERRAFALINAITVVPGAIGAFDKQAIKEAGGFATDTLAEDCDLTIRLLRNGYSVHNENSAIAYTEAPLSIKDFLKQRFRWSFGVMQVFWKNKDALFNKKFGWLGLAALPDMLLFKYIVPLFTPLADALMILGLLTGNAARIGKYYLLFLLADTICAGIALWVEKAPFSRLIWVAPQRIIYRWLMMFVLFKSFKRAIYGELQHWGVLKRTGLVKEAGV